MTKKRRGRRVKLTEQVMDAFIQAIKLGCPNKDACGCAGISETTFYRWMEWADSKRKDAKVYQEFRERIKEAEGQATQRWLAIIEKAAQAGQWQAAAWKLERRRAMFIPKVKAEVEAKIDGRVEVKDARERVLDKLAVHAERIQKTENNQ
ncbi:hypothetical protein CMI37_18085 [Candidatus Pacearchaeota archaeon]|nr:hypothetical protein [Candidatus Pacearchaeota archaeon]